LGAVRGRGGLNLGRLPIFRLWSHRLRPRHRELRSLLLRHLEDIMPLDLSNLQTSNEVQIGYPVAVSNQSLPNGQQPEEEPPRRLSPPHSRLHADSRGELGPRDRIRQVLDDSPDRPRRLHQGRYERLHNLPFPDQVSGRYGLRALLPRHLENAAPIKGKRRAIADMTLLHVPHPPQQEGDGLASGSLIHAVILPFAQHDREGAGLLHQEHPLLGSSVGVVAREDDAQALVPHVSETELDPSPVPDEGGTRLQNHKALLELLLVQCGVDGPLARPAPHGGRYAWPDLIPQPLLDLPRRYRPVEVDAAVACHSGRSWWHYGRGLGQLAGRVPPVLGDRQPGGVSRQFGNAGVTTAACAAAVATAVASTSATSSSATSTPATSSSAVSTPATSSSAVSTPATSSSADNIAATTSAAGTIAALGTATTSAGTIAALGTATTAVTNLGAATTRLDTRRASRRLAAVRVPDRGSHAPWRLHLLRLLHCRVRHFRSTPSRCLLRSVSLWSTRTRLCQWHKID
ncbi:hypothetical protein CONLIGDRAFT_697683, partial [Coniochaeta ligniaria NRRL 30616]